MSRTGAASAIREALAGKPLETIDGKTYAGFGHRVQMARRRFLTQFLFDATGGRCTVCGEPVILRLDQTEPDKAVVMHIIPSGPRKLGWSAPNLIIACNACNKSDKGVDLRPYLHKFKLIDTVPLWWPAGTIATVTDDETTRREAIRAGLGLPY